MDRQHSTPPVECVEADAAAWFARVRSGGMSAADRRALDQWLAEPDHAAAFATVEALWHAIEPLHGDPDLLPLREAARNHGRMRRLSIYGAIAATLVAAFVASVFFFNARGVQETDSHQTVRFATARGERLPIALADGSTIMLDANSSVRVSLQAGRRSVEIEQGRAFFKVSHDARRPFVVSAAGRSVTALGTAFAVDKNARQLDVVLVEGRVRVDGDGRPGGRAVELTAGGRLQIAADGSWHAGQVDTDMATAWLSGRLVFDNARLADVVDELGRYTERKIAIAPDGTAEKRLSAVLKAGDVGTFTEAVRVLQLARVQATPDGTIVLSQK